MTASVTRGSTPHYAKGSAHGFPHHTPEQCQLLQRKR